MPAAAGSPIGSQASGQRAQRPLADPAAADDADPLARRPPSHSRWL